MCSKDYMKEWPYKSQVLMSMIRFWLMPKNITTEKKNILPFITIKAQMTEILKTISCTLMYPLLHSQRG